MLYAAVVGLAYVDAIKITTCSRQLNSLTSIIYTTLHAERNVSIINWADISLHFIDSKIYFHIFYEVTSLNLYRQVPSCDPETFITEIIFCKWCFVAL